MNEETQKLLNELDIIQEQVSDQLNNEEVKEYLRLLKEKDKLVAQVKIRINNWEEIDKSTYLKFEVKKTKSYDKDKLKMILWDLYTQYVQITEKPIVKKIEKDIKDWVISDELNNAVVYDSQRIYVKEIKEEQDVFVI